MVARFEDISCWVAWTLLVDQLPFDCTCKYVKACPKTCSYLSTTLIWSSKSSPEFSVGAVEDKVVELLKIKQDYKNDKYNDMAKRRSMSLNYISI